VNDKKDFDDDGGLNEDKMIASLLSPETKQKEMKKTLIQAK
jgi:hypothetical protein